MSLRSGNQEVLDGLDTIVPGSKERSELLFRIKEEISKESDRGCALVAAAYLEDELTTLLECFLIEQSAKATKELFDFNGPLGSFSSKIKLVYSLGLISAEAASALDILRKIRNEFAHLHEPVTFESPAVKQRTTAMLPHVKEEWTSPREQFIHKMLLLAASIHLYQALTFHRTAPAHHNIPLKNDEVEHRLEVAARRLMAITAPSITYEQAMDLARHVAEFRFDDDAGG